MFRLSLYKGGKTHLQEFHDHHFSLKLHLISLSDGESKKFSTF